MWFILALKKRIALEELDKICNLNYLRNRMTINNNNNGNITRKRSSSTLIEKKLLNEQKTKTTMITSKLLQNAVSKHVITEIKNDVLEP